MNVAPKAIVPGNDFALKVSKIEKVDDTNLAYLENSGSYLFALVDDSIKQGDVYNFAIANEKVSINHDDNEVLKGIGSEETMYGTFSKKESKKDKENTLEFFYNIDGYAIPAADEKGYKINSIDGDNAYKNTYKYTIKRRNIHLADEGIMGEVVDILDYGNTCFAKIRTKDNELLINVDKGFDQKQVHLVFDSNDLYVYSTDVDMKIC